jgi:hypothetical protein
VGNLVFLSLFPKEDKAKGSPLFCCLFYYFILMGAKCILVVKRMTIDGVYSCPSKLLHWCLNWHGGKKKLGNVYSMAYGPYDFIQRRWNPFVSNDGYTTLG